MLLSLLDAQSAGASTLVDRLKELQEIPSLEPSIVLSTGLLVLRFKLGCLEDLLAGYLQVLVILGFEL